MFFSLGEKEEKVNTIQLPFLCFSHLQTFLQMSGLEYYITSLLPLIGTSVLMSIVGD